MNIAIVGLWHLGSVYASSVAAVGHRVVGWDPDPTVIGDLQKGIPPIEEKGLEQQITTGLEKKNLTFTADLKEAVHDADIIWITFDTPVDENDRADSAYVMKHIKECIPLCKDKALILISSQMPVGSIKQVEQETSSLNRKDIMCAYAPENLRLGQALHDFSHPDRIICGVRNQETKKLLTKLWQPITNRIEWMSVESAEMTKHAINAFLATSIAFGNELALLCEHTGADAKEVEKGLKSETRIGPHAYLGPGLAFSGGTLARDVQFLLDITTKAQEPSPVLHGVRSSNEYHKSWVLRKIQELLQDIKGKKITLLGLTYKPGTNTLRRSFAVECALALFEKGAHITAHDPGIKQLPKEYAEKIHLASTLKDAFTDAEALIICTCWDIYPQEIKEPLFAAMKTPYLIDPTRFLYPCVANLTDIKYVAIGLPLHQK